MQLATALGLRGSGPGAEEQIKAIKALSSSKNVLVADELASLLEPHEGLDVRRAVARTLRALPCPADCSRSILHYLERVYRGELNYEDTLSPPSSGVLRAGLREEQEEVYKDLYYVLERDREQTLANLERVYGLGTPSPSAFGLELVSRMGFEAACTALADSDQQIREIPAEWSKAPRREVRAALAALKCGEARQAHP